MSFVDTLIRLLMCHRMMQGNIYSVSYQDKDLFMDISVKALLKAWNFLCEICLTVVKFKLHQFFFKKRISMTIMTCESLKLINVTLYAKTHEIFIESKYWLMQ